VFSFYASIDHARHVLFTYTRIYSRPDAGLDG